MNEQPDEPGKKAVGANFWLGEIDHPENHARVLHLRNIASTYPRCKPYCYNYAPLLLYLAVALQLVGEPGDQCES